MCAWVCVGESIRFPLECVVYVALYNDGHFFFFFFFLDERFGSERLICAAETIFAADYSSDVRRRASKAEGEIYLFI